MARQAPSTQPCGLREARVRREQARKFLDTAHYGLIYVSRQRLKSALDQASRLVKFASDVVAP